MIELNIGSQIRRLRLEQRRTQRQIADSCGFTKSLLSKIESNKVMPPVATLVKIADSLGTKVSALIEAGSNGASVASTAAEVKESLFKTEQGYWIHPFATRHKGKRMQPFMFVVRKGEVKEHHLVHEGEEFIYVLTGRIKVQVGRDEHVLKAGDALYFESAHVHQVIPESVEARYLNIFA
jgi:transcriptional regulator with XRE-family HTH domain